jgi:hypothetical protein
MADKKRGKKGSTGWGDVFVAVANAFTVMADRIGLVGAFAFLLFFFVVMYASPAQKQEIIDTYVLFKGGWNHTLVGLLATNVLLLVAITGGFKMQLNAKQKEINRLAEWKSKHQGATIQQPTHSSVPKTT